MVRRSIYSNHKGHLSSVYWCSFSKYNQSDWFSLAFCAVFGVSVLVQSITQCAWGLRTHLGDHDSVLYFTALQIQPSSLFYIILTHKHLVDFSCLACPSGPMVSCFDISIFLLISITSLSAFFTIRQPSFVAESHENFGAKSFSLFLNT